MKFSKSIYSLSLAAVMSIFSLSSLTSCSDFEPREVPEVPVTLYTASDLKADVSGRSVTLNWTLPESADLSGVKIIVNGDNAAAINLDGRQTSYTLKGQAMDTPNLYTVKMVYAKDGNTYVSEGTTVSVTVPYIASKVGYVLLADKWEDLPDDDEVAAARWFAAQDGGEFVKPSEIASLDPDIYSVLWIEIDREGQPFGWENLPAEIVAPEVLDALREYSKNGGSLYLSNMAVQLTVPLGYVSEEMKPTIFGNGAGGTGSDVWVINPYLGWDFQNGSDQGFYDRTMHAVYQGLTLEDPNNYGYLNLPLIGPGQREDHNCMWDCNIYGKGSERDVIANFEKVTNSMVLATWGHVRDHCVAGLVDFFANADHGHCVANGLAAYEWNQNSGPNPYQKNIEGLTMNILNYLK